MPIKGTLKEGELRIAKVLYDFTKQPMHVDVTAALVDLELGSTRAWIPANGVVWSVETANALAALVKCMERDIANIMMSRSDVTKPADETRTQGGIGEHVGTTPDAPQM